ncbi:RNA polymerase sigma factor [Vagococcus elongatus]|uniref:RNA polymerase subunit sigma n=1 Tax=Vagococcus elongatus TaxID=180344 RepID=A0A430B1B2_9ENTE|nr:RNA polymerase sigma factor [Vagococcus elongatus]RSU14098.1 hypothetical protein CBF29_04235 [Vagococcus elongatus]
MKDEEWLDSFLLVLGKDVSDFLMRKGASYHEAEDVVQNTFYKTLLALDSFNQDSLRPWFFRVALNEFIDLKRREKFRDPTPLEEVDLTEAENGLEKFFMRESLLHRLSKIKPEYQEILLLKYYYELSYEEISQLLMIKKDSVKQKLARARKQLREKENQ